MIDIRRTRRFLNTFKYIDNVSVLKDGKESKRSFGEFILWKCNLRRRMILTNKVLYKVWVLK